MAVEDLVLCADVFAESAHRGQLRKYTGEPYIEHPRAVRNIVSVVCTDREVLAAALLHDVLEDTKATEAELRGLFGERVTDLVLAVTDVSKPSDGNRKRRKELDREHLVKAPVEAKTIKLADLIHNTKSIVEHDPDFAKVYLREKWGLLQVLQEGDQTLWRWARDLVLAGSSSIGLELIG